MRIVYVANARIPTEKANGIQIMKMCEAFSRLGCEVNLIIPKRVTHIPGDAFAFYQMPKTFDITYLPSLDLIRWSGVIPSLFAYLQNATFVRSALKHLQTYPADLIFTRDEMFAAKIAFARRVFLEVHNISKTLITKSKVLTKNLSAVIAISNGLKMDLVKLGFDPQKIVVLPDGVDLNRFKIFDFRLQNEIRRELGLPQDKSIVMYTGHLYEWKGAQTLLQAARNDKFLISNIKFVFVGGTDADIKKFKNAARGLSSVLILGYKPHYEIPKYLAAADVLVLPNSGKFEISHSYTSPLKLFEYMASGRPIVASDLPSIREIVDEDRVVFFKADDPNDLAKKISQVLSDEALAKRLSKNATEKVKGFTWEMRAQEIIDKMK